MPNGDISMQTKMANHIQSFEIFNPEGHWRGQEFLQIWKLNIASWLLPWSLNFTEFHSLTHSLTRWIHLFSNPKNLGSCHFTADRSPAAQRPRWATKLHPKQPQRPGVRISHRRSRSRARYEESVDRRSPSKATRFGTTTRREMAPISVSPITF